MASQPSDPPENDQDRRSVRLDQHESVRSHVHRRLNDEVAQLERRIETLRLAKSPHAAIMISAYERMIERKKGFIERWRLGNAPGGSE
ncbi:MAG: hypothetical protein R3175_08300 [Marinobacter sp.]|uniref:hypothetical protein n=1 Tax=Marinobacter sp. TaxID=50741 RepID=UPI00299D6079|nr:hypothetical protein [Marinobacter sp.]MDX1756042.1 hypothetical protein [Marinobacter sp.]